MFEELIETFSANSVAVIHLLQLLYRRLRHSVLIEIAAQEMLISRGFIVDYRT